MTERQLERGIAPRFVPLCSSTKINIQAYFVTAWRDAPRV